MEDLYQTTFEKSINENYLILGVSGTTTDGDDFVTPPIQYLFKWNWCCL